MADTDNTANTANATSSTDSSPQQSQKSERSGPCVETLVGILNAAKKEVEYHKTVEENRRLTAKIRILEEQREILKNSLAKMMVTHFKQKNKKQILKRDIALLQSKLDKLEADESSAETAEN